MNFLLPGHTHSNLDQKYAVVSQHIKATELFLIDHVMEEVSELFEDMGPLTSQVKVTTSADFFDFYKDFRNDLKGHGTCKVNGVNRRLHSFKICKHSTNTSTPGDPVVGVFYKEHDEAGNEDTGNWRGRWDTDPEWEPVIVLHQPHNLSNKKLPSSRRRQVLWMGMWDVK
jgi:hypothetical protein